MRTGAVAACAAISVAHAGCVRYRTLRVESAVPARVETARGEAVHCPATPCRIRVSRNWPFDSSLHFILLRATAADGRTDQMALDTHKVRDGQKVVFSFK